MLRPISALGLLDDGTRLALALSIRVLFLIIMGGLLWNLYDRWKESR